MRMTLVTGLLMQAVCFFACSANATEINLVPQSKGEARGAVAYANLVTPANTVSANTLSDAVFTLNIAGGNIAGDFDNNESPEIANVLIEGYSLGTTFDNNIASYLFDFPNDDDYGDHNSMLTMTGEEIVDQADRENSYHYGWSY
jgi:hypothetical protein